MDNTVLRSFLQMILINILTMLLYSSKVSHSSQLVGQINRNEKSEQYTFPLNDDVGKRFQNCCR